MEIFEDLADVDAVFVSVGGGGLIGGIAAYLKSVKPEIRVTGLNEEGKWIFLLNVHRMIRESHATLLVGFSITAGYRRLVRTLTTVCWAWNQALVFWFCLAAFFPGTDTYHTIGRLWKKLLKPKLLHWMKKYESGVRIFSRNLPSCRMFFCLATSTFVQKIRNVKSLRSAAVAASFPAKMIHQNNTHSSARPRFALVNGQTTTDFFFCAHVSLYEHNSQTLSKHARGDQLWPAPCQQLLSYKVNERKLKSS